MDRPELILDADEMLGGINRWVAIESKTEEPDGINRMMQVAMADFRDAGCAVQEIPGTQGLGPHFHARAPWGGDGPGILVLCHLDTVHPAGTLSDNPIRTEGDHAFGPGIYDMKGGVFIALTAARLMMDQDTPERLPLRFLVVSDEEIGSPTSQAHIEQAGQDAKFVLVVEPARDGGRVVTARKGSARMRIAARGRPAHSGGRHQDGESAVLEIARQIVDLEAMTDYDTGITMNIGLVSGGTATNVVPEHCAADIDIRMSRIEDAEPMVNRVRSLKPYNSAVTLDVTGGMNRPPFQKSNSIAALFEHARGLAAELGFELEDTFSGGGSDGNFTAALAPTLDGLGVDGEGAHTLEEFIRISSIVPRTLLLKRLFETLR